VRWGKLPPAAEPIAPDSCQALREGRAHCLLPHAAEPVCAHVPPPPPLVSMCIPLVAKAETLGLFHLQRPAAAPGEPTTPAEYSDYKLRLAHAAAEQIAGAIANATLHEKLRAQAIRDPLTGLLNRRSLEESLAHELHRAQRRESKVGVLMLDIDHFKKWNDRHGHAAGDHVLREIARFLGQCTRKEDIVCRYGGEEITIVLADCSLANLRRRAEQICRGVRGVKIEFDGKPCGTVTVSVGAALHPDHGQSPEELLRAADQALYRAKAAGRDRVEVAVASPTDRSEGVRTQRSRAKG
jgi:diguanylate cyclase (GGDEF)-like protein